MLIFKNQFASSGIYYYIVYTNYNNMNTLDKIQVWGDRHHPKWLDVFRITLGLVLVWKGIAFLFNLDVLADFLRETGLTDQIGTSVLLTLLTYFIIGLHVVGGICIALGTRTRLYCLLNLPVLIGAVILVNLRENILKPYAEFWLSLFVLIAVICFLVEGDGPWAISRERKVEKQA
jgi:putative oxidoreductase